MLSTSPAVTTNNTEFSETLKRKHSRSDVTLQDDNPKKILCDWSRGWLNDPVSFKQLGNKPPKTTCSVEDEEQTVDAPPGDDLELFDSHEPGFASGGKLTLWQFLLELLLSNKHTNIIRWTEKEGEFILLQAESVAKLWGLRKDRNHRMNYDKLSRALRYYYEKNIIRKVHGHKFVYQFIDLRNLIKFYHGTLCDNVWNTERSISPEETRISDRLPQTSLEQQNTEAIPIKTEPVIPISPEPEEPTRNLLRPRDGFSKGRSTIVQQYENSTTFLNPSSPSPTPAYVQPKSYSRCFDSLINGKTEGVSGAETVNLSTLLSSINSVLSVGNLLSSIPAYFNQSSNHSVHSVLHNDKSECSHPRTTTPDTLIGPVLPPYPFRCPTTGVSGHVEPDHIARMLKELTRVSTHDATSSPPDSPIPDWSRIASGKLHPHRSSSPNCQCSCHTTPPTMNKLGTCVNGWTTDARMRSDLSSDEATSVQLHHQRHEINMKRLSEQISRLNRSSVLNAANETISSLNQSVHSDANEDLTRERDRSSDESMPDRYVWMPVPMAMLTTWFNLLKSSVNPPGSTTDSSQSNCKATSGGRTSSETQ